MLVTNILQILSVFLIYPSGNEPIKVFGKGRANLEGDWENLLSIASKWTNQIDYCLFTQVATAQGLLLVQGVR